MNLEDDLAIYEAHNRMEDAFVASDRFNKVIKLLEMQLRSNLNRLPATVTEQEYNHVVNHIVAQTESTIDRAASQLTHDHVYHNLTVSIRYPDQDGFLQLGITSILSDVA